MKFLPPPGPARRRQLLLLACTLVALVVLAYRELAPTGATAQASNSPTRAAGPVGPVTLPESIKLDALTAVPEDAEIGRNPFGFGVKPAPPAPPPRAYTLPPAAMMAPTQPMAPAGPPPITLKLTGMMIVPGSGRPMVMLKDPNGAVFEALEGDVVDGRYRVVKIGVESVIVSYLDGSGQRTIGLGR